MSGLLPNGWALSNLDEIATSVGGGTPSKSDPSLWTGGTIPWVSPKDMKVRTITTSEDRITESALNRLSMVPANSVLAVVRSGILSHTFPVAETVLPVTINQDMRAFVPSKGVAPNFLAWQLTAKGSEILRTCAKNGTTVASIEGPALSRFPIWIAPVTEQSRIVAKLEELLSDLDAGVAELKAAQRKLQQYRQSLLKAAVEGSLTADWRARIPPSETGADLLARILKERRARWEAVQASKFEAQGKLPPAAWRANYPEPLQAPRADLPDLPDGWVWVTIDELSPDDLANGRSVPSADHGAKVLRLNSITQGKIDLSEFKYGAWTAEEAAPFAVTDGDLLIARGNGSLRLVGRAGLVSDVSEPVAYPDTMIRLRTLDAVVSPAWIGLVWDSQLVRTHIEHRARTSAGIYKISQPDIVSVVIPLPPISEQDQILAVIGRASDEIDRTRAALALGLKQSSAQRQNILRAAFAGQLVPQDPSDEPASALLARIRAERAAEAAGRPSRSAGRLPSERRGTCASRSKQSS